MRKELSPIQGICLVLIIMSGIVLTVKFANPTPQNSVTTANTTNYSYNYAAPSRIRTARPSKSTCSAVTRQVKSFSQRYFPERKNLVVHCEGHYMAFEVHQQQESILCRASIMVYHPGQYVVLNPSGCVPLGRHHGSEPEVEVLPLEGSTQN
jgi:hypothetical protein